MGKWGQGGVTVGQNQWCFVLSSDGENDILGFAFEIGDNRMLIQKETGIVLNEWNLATTTYDGQLIKFYVNGELIDSQDIGTDKINLEGRNLKFAVNDIGTSILYSEVLLDDFRVYDAALTEQEVVDLFNADPVSTNEIIAQFKTTTYPNPVTNELIIDVEQPSLVENVVVYNAIGQVIYKGQFAQRIDVTSLTSGVYFLTLFDEKERILHRGKFVKKN